MWSRRSKRSDPTELDGGGDVDTRFRSKNVMSKLRGKLWKNRSSGLLMDGEMSLSRGGKAATLPARVKPDQARGAGGNDKTRTLYWMEGYLGPYEESLRRSPGVTRKDSDESVDSGFEQTPKTEGSETESNSSPAQQSKALPPSPSLCHEGHEVSPPPSHKDPPLPLSHHQERSNSPLDEPHYQLVPSNSMYDEAAFDKAFGPMKDVSRWYSTYSSRQQLQLARGPVVPRREKQLPDTPDEEEEEEEEECGPAVPIRISSISVLEEYEQRLISRPLPPIPAEQREPSSTAATPSGGRSGSGRLAASHPPVRPRPKPRVRSIACCDDSDAYELVEHRMRGTNPLMLGLRNIAKYGWYWGPVTRIEAEEKLQGTDDGTFLVRDSSDDRYLLSLSFRSQNKTLHTRIEYSNGFFSFYSFPDSDSEGYRSVVDLIEWSMEHSRAGIFCFSRGKAMGSPAVPVRLLKPLSRFNQVRSLQHYCRFVIRQSIRFDCIRQLPLPRHVHGFLEQSQF